jgi:hypothetical protein
MLRSDVSAKASAADVRRLELKIDALIARLAKPT